MKRKFSTILVTVLVMGLLFALSACSGANSKWVGNWEATSAEVSGEEIDLDELDVSFSLDIEKGGEVTATTNGTPDGNNTWTEEDGSLVITNKDDETIRGKLNDDGQLVLEFSDQDLVFYMDKKDE